MTEFDTLYLLQEKIATFWDVFQYWSGVTFAYIAVSHFMGNRLSTVIVVVLSVIYSAMFLHVLQLIGQNHASIDALVVDLRALAASTDQVSSATKAQLESSDGMSTVPPAIAIFGSYIAALLYLPYRRYFANEASNDSP